MLSERERRLLAQIEAHMRAEEPALSRLLATGGRWAVLRWSGVSVGRGLLLIAFTVLVGVGMALAGAMTGYAALLAAGLTTAIVVPLPVWLSATRGDPAVAAGGVPAHL